VSTVYYLEDFIYNNLCLAQPEADNYVALILILVLELLLLQVQSNEF